MDHLQLSYPHAGPAIRHALCAAADRVTSAVNPVCRHAYQGEFDGLAHALEILTAAEDTPVHPGIAWLHLLPPTAVEHTRHILGTPLADRLLGPTP
jgi:hypothetical protein